MAGKETQSSTAEKRGHLARTVSVISEAVEDEAIQGESSESADNGRRPTETTPSQSAPEASTSGDGSEERRSGSPKHDGDEDPNNSARSSEGSGDTNTVTRVFLYEVVSGIRLSCLAEEDGTSVSADAAAGEKKPRRHKHAGKRLKKNKATSLRHSLREDEQLDAVFVEHNPEPFLTAEENPVPRATITLEAEAIAAKHGLQAKEFRRNSRWLLKTQPTESGERLDVEIKTYAATIFRRIRMASGVSTDEFCNSWNYTFKDLPQMHTGAGRSGSLFLASSDGRFFFKTLPYVEVQTLMDILPAYFDYITEHPESRLMRVFNILRFSDPRRIHGYLYLIVFPNAFYSPDRLLIHEKYDLKGRVPKPGKEGRHTLDNVDPVRYVFKDNDITSRRYLLPATSREELAQALTNDVSFLKTNGCMDYSLLVGVHHLSSDDKDKIRDELRGSGSRLKKHRRKRSSPSTTAAATPHSSSSVSSSSSSAAASSSDAQPSRASSATPPPPKQLTLLPPESKRGHRRSRSSDHRGGKNGAPSSAETASPRRRSFSMARPTDPRIAHRFGMLSADGRETYFISIIDFLARYTMAKKGAHFFKTFLWTPETLSTVPPDYYGDRWLRAMLQCFPPGGEEIADPHFLSPVVASSTSSPAPIAPVPIAAPAPATLIPDEDD